MIISSITVLLEEWQDHQLTNRELIGEGRQLTPDDRTLLRAGLQQIIASRDTLAATT
jgi:hypothetical protein